LPSLVDAPTVSTCPRRKTAVCAALILANPYSATETKPEIKPFVAGASDSDASDLRKSKLTVVICNNTLVRQWFDEVTRWAPKLRVGMLYASHSKKTMTQLKQLDVLITTPHMKMPAELANTQVHRMIYDEAQCVPTFPAAPQSVLYGSAAPRPCLTATVTSALPRDAAFMPMVRARR
jgi:hypothetical protein